MFISVLDVGIGSFFGLNIIFIRDCLEPCNDQVEADAEDPVMYDRGESDGEGEEPGDEFVTIC
jgi:hypothetical protein